jgi:hypothetical protein
MTKPKLCVDFNELVGEHLVLLSQTDITLDSAGAEVRLHEGLDVLVFEYNEYQDGTSEYLFVEGVAERNNPAVNGNWTKAAKWCCRFEGEIQIAEFGSESMDM